jgi:hypothetical protein|tara:strand:- start:16 stop:528 length:513 start_codon:yes stop_codon:yes gene_type:complete
MSTLKVNSIIPVAGVPTGGGGGTTQIKQTVKTDTFTSTSTSFVDITGLSVSITPTSTSSKIFIIVDLQVGSDNDSQCMFLLVRDSTSINLGDASGSRIQCFAEQGSGEDYHQHSCSTHFLDSPSTTSAVTYKVQMRVTGAFHAINRSDDDSNASSEARTTSSITVMEVSA